MRFRGHNVLLEPGGYRPTGDDRLWLLRAVEGEGAPHPLVAQALVNRFMFLRWRAEQAGDAPPYATLASFVRAYSQPVNPRWQRGGDRFAAAFDRATTPEERRRLLALNERRREHSMRKVFGPATEQAVQIALIEGPRNLPRPTTTDFAAPSLQAGAHLVQHTDHVKGQNTFYGLRKDYGWPGYTVRMGPQLMADNSPGAALLAVGLGLVLVVALGGGRS